MTARRSANPLMLLSYLETLLMAFVPWATMVQEETAALSQWQLDRYIHPLSLYLFYFLSQQKACVHRNRNFLSNI